MNPNIRIRMIIAALCLLGIASAQAQLTGRRDQFWQKYLTGNAGPVEYGADAACVDALGNVYIAGNFQDDGLQSMRVAKWSGGQWQILGERFSGGRAEAIAVDGNGNVYVGGYFEIVTNSDGSEVDVLNIAKWNKATGQWEALGGGVDDDVLALAVDNNNNVYVGGNLTRGFNPNGAQVTIWRVGKWNVAQAVWEPLGEGLINTGSNPVTALAVAANNDVIVGGEFLGVYNPGRVQVLTPNIARWNGASWSALGLGLTPNTSGGERVAGIVIDNANRIYVAGAIATADNANGASVDGPLVYWDGTQWHRIATSPTSPRVDDLALDGAGKIYMLYSVDVSIKLVEAWNGSTWTTLVYKNRFPHPSVIAANPKYPSEFLYLGGEFTDFYCPAIINTVQVANNARWDGQRWFDMVSFGATGEVFAVAADNNGLPSALYVGGNFTSIEGHPASNIARFDGTNWDALSNGVNGPVYAIASVSYNSPGVFVGGVFSLAINPDGSPVRVSNIAFWDHTQRRWFPVGNGLNGPVYALEVFSYALYAGGAFTQELLNGPTLNRIARWDFSTQQWEPFGGGVDGGMMPEVRTLAVGRGGSVSSPRSWRSVYVGGNFTEATNRNGSKTFCRNIIMWDGYDNTWRELGNGVDDEVLALALAGPDYSSPLYIGGRFRTGVNDNGALVNIDHIAMWYSYDWRALGNGVNGAVTTIVPAYDRTQFYIGGEFTEAVNSNGVVKPANHIAVFERTYAAGVVSEWDALGSGTNDMVHAIASVWPCPRNAKTEVLFVGGKFNLAGNKGALALAKWKYERPFSNRGTSVVVHSSSSRNNSGTGQRSRGVLVTSGSRPCNPGLGKKSNLADELIFDNLGFRESAELPGLPYLEPFSLQLYDVEDPNTPTATFDSLVVSSENPQALILFGLNDTTAYAPNPEGYSIRENTLLLDLPILTNNPNEVRAVFMHAATDAPTVDLVTANGETLVSNLNYGGASAPISLPAGAYTVDLLRSSDKQNLGTHTLDVSSNANGYAVITLSGFLNPGTNQNGPAAALEVYEVKLTPATAVEEQIEAASVSFELRQNYPNPFNPATSVQFSVGASSGAPVHVSLKVYDVLGNEVATLVDEKKPAGFYRVRFDAKGLANGVYFYRLQAGDFTATHKMLLVR
ncbi:MAG: hypothetical protein ALAOOOJD_01457 [bacterium]|nr:hypothetical protein [bacterium]